MRLYTCTAIDNALDQLRERGYDIIQLQEGCLANGHIVALAPDNSKWNFETREVPLNEWSSAQTWRRFSKASKRLLKEIEEAEAEEEEEYAS